MSDLNLHFLHGPGAATDQDPEEDPFPGLDIPGICKKELVKKPQRHPDGELSPQRGNKEGYRWEPPFKQTHPFTD